MINPSIFKAYDIRGIYPKDLDEEGMYLIIQAYAKFIGAKKVVLSKDVRESGPVLKSAAIKALTDMGVEVIDIGTVSTEIMYFASATLDVDGGLIISASHNPKEWNGLNLTRAGAVPISLDTGLTEIKKIAMKGEKVMVEPEKKGKVEEKSILDDYIDYVLSYINVKKVKPFKIVANPNFGMQGKIFERLVQRAELPIEIFPLNFEPDGTFPKGPPNPLLDENRAEIVELVKKEKADLGVSWDADGDRCFFVDDKGRFIEGYFMTAILAGELLEKNPGEKIIIDTRLRWASIDTVKEKGGEVIVNRAGMTLIAERMKKEGALFAGEMSAHYYFRKNWNRDNGMIPLLVVLEMLSAKDKKLFEIVQPYFDKYFISGEINFQIEDKEKIMETLEKKYSDGKIDHIDGLSVEYADWRFNLRPSNTEPLVRLNIEAKSQELVNEKRDELTKFISS
jgi:phosphomannomutase